MPEMISDAVAYEATDEVAVITLDDGKANAVGHALADAANDALDRAEDEGKAVVLLGRDGRFSAGFDLDVMTSGDVDATRQLLRAGAELALRVYMHPQPVVIGCTGHALAMGAILLMAGDVRVGADGPYKIGMNEVSIGIALPRFAIELGRDRLSRRHINRATQLATVYDPAGAVDAGYLDETCALESVRDRAVAIATDAATGLHPEAFRSTRELMRGDTARLIADGLDADMGDFFVNL